MLIAKKSTRSNQQSMSTANTTAEKNAEKNAENNAEKSASVSPTTRTDAPSEFADERVIRDIWPALFQSNGLYQLASKIPLGLGLFLFVPVYLVKVLNVFSAPRFTLTTRRLRLDRGVHKRIEDYVLLDDIEEVRIAEEVPFTRTGNLEIICNGKVRMTLNGVQDPLPARHNILSAVQARKSVQAVLRQFATAT